MSQSYEAQGIIHSIGDTTEYGQNGFTKREFVIKLSGENENPAYPNHIALELIRDKCALRDQYNIGDEIEVHFNLSGRLWSGGGKGEKCFTSLQAWRVNLASGQSRENAGAPASNASPPDGPPPAADGEYDDIPF